MRSLRRRLLPLLTAAAAVGAVAVLVLVVLAARGAVTWMDALTLAAVAAVGALVCALGAGTVTLRRAVRDLQKEVEEHAHRVTEALGQNRVETVEVMEGVRGHITRARDTAVSEIGRGVRRAVEVQGRNDYEQQVAWTELRDHLGAGPFLPPLRGWAASPDVLRILVGHIERMRPGTVVECGSGSSSVWIGHALRRVGTGRLVALEHDARYAELSRAMVASHGLGDIVEIRHAPLVEIDSATVTVDGEERTTADRWYDPSALADLQGVGLVFVDGPPAATGLQARYPAVPRLLPHCTEDAVFVLDDADRPDECALGDRWLAEYPELHRTEEAAEKGAHVFSRKSI